MIGDAIDGVYSGNVEESKIVGDACNNDATGTYGFYDVCSNEVECPHFVYDMCSIEAHDAEDVYRGNVKSTFIVDDAEAYDVEDILSGNVEDVHFGNVEDVHVVDDFEAIRPFGAGGTVMLITKYNTTYGRASSDAADGEIFQGSTLS